MVPFHRAFFAPALLALFALGQGAAAQSSLAPTQGNLPPPRPLGQAAPRLVPSEQPRPLALPPTPPASPATTPPASPAITPAQRPAPPRATAPARSQAPPRAAAPARPQAPSRAAAAPPSRAAAAPPTLGRPTPPPSRRPGTAAAGSAAAGSVAAGTVAAGAVAAGAVAAGAVAAGATAAAARGPELGRPTPPPPVPSTGSVTSRPLPRFVSLGSDEVNMRVGPSTSYPIEWTFQRRDLPVQIIGEFRHWRRIRDAEGAEGWVHSSTLVGRRTVLVRPANAPDTTLRRRAEDAAAAVARIHPGVIARIRECAAGAPWCEVQIAGHRGFLRRTELWGVGLEEEIK